jgi:hypothetical protein
LTQFPRCLPCFASRLPGESFPPGPLRTCSATQLWTRFVPFGFAPTLLKTAFCAAQSRILIRAHFRASRKMGRKCCTLPRNTMAFPPADRNFLGAPYHFRERKSPVPGQNPRKYFALQRRSSRHKNEPN